MTMSERVLLAVKEQLKREFPTWNRYSMTKDQGIVEPCFLIRVRVARLNRQLMRRFWYHSTVEIVAVPLPDPTHEHLQAVREQMLFALEEMPLGERFLRTQNDPGARIVDDAIHFEATYKVLLEKETLPEDVMEFVEEQKIYTDPDAYDEAVEPDKDPGMWEWQEESPYTSEEEEGLMKEIENRLTP